MKSKTTRSFQKQYRQLPTRIRSQARKVYRIWRQNPRHSSLHFKHIGQNEPVYSVRIGLHWRALCLLENDTAIWWWIGSHAEYDAILRRIK